MDILDKDTLARPPIWAICRKCRNCASRLCKECKRYDLFEEYVTAEQIRMAKDNGWISVKDKLPKLELPRDGQFLGISETVLIVADIFDVDRAYSETIISFGYYLTDGKNTVWVDDVNGYREDYEDGHIKVTHWMPLPEPPKGEINHGMDCF